MKTERWIWKWDRSCQFFFPQQKASRLVTECSVYRAENQQFSKDYNNHNHIENKLELPYQASFHLE